MKMYRSTSIFSTPLMLLIPTYKEHEGVAFKEYPKEGPVFFGSFKTYGGTNLKGSQKTAAEVMTIIDTANIECFYRPDIKAECRIKNLINNNVYDIINEPEDIEQRRVMLKFKVQRLKGGL